MRGNMGNRNHICFSSKKDDWCTPQRLFNQLNAEFHFDCDAAASTANTKCKMYFGEDLTGRKENSLVFDWLKCMFMFDGAPEYPKVFFLNPPYSKNKEFIKKAFEESQKGAIVVCLLPSRTDTEWWHEYVMKSAEIRFIRGRLYFNDEINPAPFPSCIVIFKQHDHSLPKISTTDCRVFRRYEQGVDRE